MKRFLLVGLVAACATNGDGTGTGSGSASGGPPIAYEAFTPKTASVGVAMEDYQLAISDGTGPIACGLASDQHNSLGAAGHEILVDLTSAELSESSCELGTYSVPSNCPADPGANESVAEHCAYYRTFDATGKSTGFVAATAGVVTMGQNENAQMCEVSVQLSFSGTQFTASFDMVYQNGLFCSTPP